MPNGHIEHTEAAWLFFTELHYRGQKFNVTVREGGDDKIPDMVNAIVALYASASEAGFQLPGQLKDRVEAKAAANESQPPAEEKPTQAPLRQPSTPLSNKGQVDAAKPDQEKGIFHISKIRIAGTKAKPQVQMFTPNTKLAYAVIFGPPSVVGSMLTRDIPEDELPNMDWIGRVGEEYQVDWSVAWVKSDKESAKGNPYLNITEIISHKAKK